MALLAFLFCLCHHQGNYKLKRKKEKEKEMLLLNLISTVQSSLWGEVDDLFLFFLTFLFLTFGYKKMTDEIGHVLMTPVLCGPK